MFQLPTLLLTIIAIAPAGSFTIPRQFTSRHSATLSATSLGTATTEEIKAEIENEIRSTKRGRSASADKRAKVDSLVKSLEVRCPYAEPARMPTMGGKWIVNYTTAPPPSNGKLGPFEGIARQIIDLDDGTYINYLSVPGDVEKEWLSARLVATFEEWDGSILDDDREQNVNSNASDGLDNDSASLVVEDKGDRSLNWLESITSIFQPDTGNSSVDYGADSWKVDFKTLTIKVFGIQLLQKTFDEGTSRVWKMTYLDDDGTRIVRAGRTGEEKDAMLFYMQRDQ